MPRIILLPGLACDAELWRDQVDMLAQRWSVAVSDAHARHATLPEMARALLAEQAGELVLVGHSMGGMLAQHVRRAAPDRVKAMALLATTARADTPELIRLRSDAIEKFERGEAEEVLRANVVFAFHPGHHGADAALTQRYVEMVMRAGADQLIAQNRAVMARADMRPWLADIRCPTLVACGDMDLLTPLEHAQEIACGIAGARLEVVAGAGHMMTMEQPQPVAALLEDWLASLG